MVKDRNEGTNHSECISDCNDTFYNPLYSNLNQTNCSNSLNYYVQNDNNACVYNDQPYHLNHSKVALTKKGSFTTKNHNPQAKAAAYALENLKFIEKTSNATLYIFGLDDYKTDFSSYKKSIGTLHFITGIADFIASEGESYISIFNSLMYNTNIRTNNLAGYDPITQCIIESAFAFGKGGKLPAVLDGSLTSPILTSFICINKEFHPYPQYEEEIHLALNIVKTALYFYSSAAFIPTITAMKVFWLAKDLSDKLIDTITVLNIKSDPTLPMMTNTYYDYEEHHTALVALISDEEVL